MKAGKVLKKKPVVVHCVQFFISMCCLLCTVVHLTWRQIRLIVVVLLQLLANCCFRIKQRDTGADDDETLIAAVLLCTRR